MKMNSELSSSELLRKRAQSVSPEHERHGLFAFPRHAHIYTAHDTNKILRVHNASFLNSFPNAFTISKLSVS